MSIYYVASNLNRDGRDYKRGDTIDLAETEAAAQELLGAGVIQAQELGDAHTETPAPVRDAPAQPEVTGKRIETGESSIDGRAPDSAETDNAKDITPGTENGAQEGIRALSPDVGRDGNAAPVQGSDAPIEPTETMGRPELEAIAIAEGMSEQDAKAAQNKGALVELILEHRKGAATEPVEPERDASAGL